MDIESILNIDCSMFASAKSTVPVSVNLLYWLRSDKYLPQQQQVREAADPDAKGLAKKAMPCITPSGQFSKRGKKFLLQHTGLIAIDIDMKENIQLTNYDDLKSELCKIPNVAYCGLSVSGTGYWLLIPIAYPEKHELHFEFIRQYFKNKNLIIDKACSDVARLRFYSYDADAYFNHAAKPLQSHYTPPLILQKQLPAKKFDGGNKPVWDQYNECEEFIKVLNNHGWVIDSTKGNKTYFTRPGKQSGISAEYDSSKNVFYVFTENGQPFEPNNGYNPFQIYAILDYAGDFSKAAKALFQSDSKNASIKQFKPQQALGKKAPLMIAAPATKVVLFDTINNGNLTPGTTLTLEQLQAMARQHFKRSMIKDKAAAKVKYFTCWVNNMAELIKAAGSNPQQFLDILNNN